MQGNAEGGGAPGFTQETEQWRLRDTLAAALLFVATAAFVLWQNSRVAVLWDLGYLLDTSYRIALGQMPYRDFPLVHAPLTFLIQAALIKLAGRYYLIPVSYAAFSGGLATLIAWRILLCILYTSRALGAHTWRAALLLACPLTVLGIYSVYPHPIYDCDCSLAILFALWFLIRLATAPARQNFPGFPLVAGAAIVLPLFFKQNMGLPFLAVVVAATILLLVRQFAQSRSFRATLRSCPAVVLAGIAATLLAGAAVIAFTAGLGNYLRWTVQFAAQRRLPSLASMLSVYQQPSFFWTVPTLAAGLVLCHTRFIARASTRIAALLLIAGPLIASLIDLFIQDDADERADHLLALWPLWLLAALIMALLELRRGLTLNHLLPIFVLAAIHGTFLSQQLWGSTYALWPLLLILIAGVLAQFPVAARSVAFATAVAVGMTFLVCGGFYAISLERLSYVQIPDAPIEYSALPALRGMADRGAFLPNFDELVDFTRRAIPPDDPLLVLPGEDPFYYATGRTPRFPVLLFDPATDPYAAPELLAEAGHRNVQWVIFKRALQINADPLPDSTGTRQLIAKEFALFHQLKGYDIYLRR
ncbi:MAG TPA: hypothetical protein VGG81_11295 [Edaphobacter sp.]|jgi:hypothetical protein